MSKQNNWSRRKPLSQPRRIDFREEQVDTADAVQLYGAGGLPTGVWHRGHPGAE